VAAFAGLVPRIRDSGTLMRGRARLSELGTSRLRKTLYFPAITALRFNPLITAFVSDCLFRVKVNVGCGYIDKEAAPSGLRCLKSQQPFDPTFRELNL
jgi:hypothetical protein